MIDYAEVEKKWQKAWAEARAFEAEPDARKPLMVTAAFPYVNSPQHIGHLRTYATADAYARYMRMKGFNVLYPMAFQPSGLPILGMAKRIANGDQEIIADFRDIYQVPEEDIAKMKDPLYLANYFTKEIEAGMHGAGYSIDWRRSFTSIDPIFSKMVEWQFAKLKEKGFLTQGTHPVGWCTNEGNAVGGHDTRGDIQPKIEELTVIKFKESSSSISFPCATYRPETIYGVTNLFINENIQYSIVVLGGQEYYMSNDAAKTLSQQFDLTVKGVISAKELLGKKGINPVTKEEVQVLPGYFVKAGVGTGVVMSVPAHAPFDYIALERLKVAGYSLGVMQYRKVIGIEPGKKDGALSTNEIPALAHLALLGTDMNATDDLAERATKAIYKQEAHSGVMLTGDYMGKPEPEARKLISDELIGSGDAFQIYTLANEEPVICRCGTNVIVKVVSDQWFINYGDPAWKQSVKAHLQNMSIVPNKLRHTYENVIEWIDLRAAERAQGLGTPFPYNTKHMIESLSDSTIYPLLYTFYNLLARNGAKPDNMKPAFFDFITNDVGSTESVASSTGIDKMVVQKCKESFDYWYSNTSRHSGLDLIPNHLTMYIFNHIAIFPKKFWPWQIVSNGLVSYEGEKMSKSLGNIVPLRIALQKYGADPLRMIEVAGADLDTEFGFSPDVINSVRQRNETLLNFIGNLDEMSGVELSHIDYWLYSRLSSKIRDATTAMDAVSFRGAYNEIYYNSIGELKWYFERGGNNSLVVREFLEKITLMLGPVMPHIAEELWQRLGKSTLVAKEQWPVFDKGMISPQIEALEETIKRTIEDVANIVGLTAKAPANAGKKVKTVRILIADDWKAKAYNALAGKKSMSDAISSQSAPEKEKVSKFLSQFASKARMLQPIVGYSSEATLKGFGEAKEFLSERLRADVIVEPESSSSSSRASRALPDKPSIEVTWA